MRSLWAASLFGVLVEWVSGTVEVRLWTSAERGFSPFVYVNFDGFPGGASPVVIDTGSPLLWGQSSCFTATATVSTTAASAGSGSGAGGPDAPCPPAVIRGPTSGPDESFGYGGGAIRGPELGSGSVLSIYQGPTPGEPVNVTAPMIAAATDGMHAALGILGMDQASTTAPLLFAQHRIPRVFQIQLVKPRYTPGGSGSLSPGGTMVLGGSSAALSTGAQDYIPLLPFPSRIMPAGSMNAQGVAVNGTSWWQFAVGEISFGGMTHPPGQAIADTGTSQLLVTPAIYGAMAAAVQQNCSGYDSYPVLELRAGNVRISLGPEQYVLRISVPYGGGVTAGVAEECVLLAASMPELPDNFFVLGDPLFWKYTVLFDYDARRIGLALSTGVVQPLATGGAQPSDPVSHPGTASREKLSAGDDVGIGIAALCILMGCGVVAMYMCKLKCSGTSQADAETHELLELSQTVSDVAAEDPSVSAYDELGSGAFGKGPPLPTVCGR